MLTMKFYSYKQCILIHSRQTPDNSFSRRISRQFFFVTPTVRFYCYREMSIGLSTGISSWKDDLLAFPRFETSVYL